MEKSNTHLIYVDGNLNYRSEKSIRKNDSETVANPFFVVFQAAIADIVMLHFDSPADIL